jgi:ribosome-associated toxin RatA of RatAB toxin-antitoxin module
VNAIEQYPQFIPWCVGSEVLLHNNDEIHARLKFEKGGVSKSFSTVNRLSPHKMIEIRLLDGPFKHLEGFWRFDPLDNGGSRVTLDLNFEFATKIVGMMVGPFFQQIASSLVDAFTERAYEVYDD